MTVLAVSGRNIPEGDAAAWQLVLAAWASYREWVSKVLGLCGKLAECISAEQVWSFVPMLAIKCSYHPSSGIKTRYCICDIIANAVYLLRRLLS